MYLQIKSYMYRAYDTFRAGATVAGQRESVPRGIEHSQPCLLHTFWFLIILVRDDMTVIKNVILQNGSTLLAHQMIKINKNVLRKANVEH